MGIGIGIGLWLSRYKTSGPGFPGDGTQYSYYTDGTDTFRKGVRALGFVVDVAHTELGFNGAENVDWENLVSYNKP